MEPLVIKNAVGGSRLERRVIWSYDWRVTERRMAVAKLIRGEADADISARRANALRALAERLELLPKGHPLTDVLESAPELPTDVIYELVKNYAQTASADPERFIWKLAETVTPGSGPDVTRATGGPRPAWIIASPLALVGWKVWNKKAPCPECRSRIPRDAKVCRYCGYRF
jgi:ribosomal protein L40E